jgi:hypothetical protein
MKHQSTTRKSTIKDRRFGFKKRGIITPDWDKTN